MLCCPVTTSVIILIVVIILIITPEGIVQQLLALLADDGLLVSALDVVPLDPILTEDRGEILLLTRQDIELTL